MATSKLSQLTGITDASSDDSLLYVADTADNLTFTSRKIRIADLRDDLNATTKADVGVDHLEILTGAGADAEDLGLFTGTIIPDNSTIKGALQVSEAYAEAATSRFETSVGLGSVNSHMGTFTGTTLSDNTDIKTLLQELETAVEGIDTSIAPGSVGTTELANLAVTAAKLALGAVGTLQLADSAVTTAKLDNGAVTSLKLAIGAVGNLALAADAVDTAEIVDSAVTSAKLASGISVKTFSEGATPTADATPSDYYHVVVDSATGALKIVDVDYLTVE